MSKKTSEKQAISDKLGKLHFLVADSGVSRRSIAKILSDLGVPRAQVALAESLHEAMELLKKKPANVVFAEQDLDGKPGMDLLKAQKDAITGGEPHAFFLLTSKDSNMLATSAADEDIDAVLVKPFTFQVLEDRIKEVVREKLDLTPYLRKVEEGKSALNAGDAQKALALFREAIPMDPKPQAARYYEGLALLRAEKYPDAIQCFNQVLAGKPDHLLSQVGLFDAYYAMGDFPRAYEAGTAIAQKQSIPVKKLPDFIRLSILNGKFDGILEFYETFSQVDQLPSQAALSIAAGIAVCGLYFLRNGKQESAVAAFKKAEILSKSYPSVLKRIIIALLSEGLDSEVSYFQSRATPEVNNSPEVRLAEVQFWFAKGNPSSAMQLGIKAISEGIHDEKLFETVIRASVQLKRNENSIKELVDQGSRLYPDKAGHFQELLK